MIVEIHIASAFHDAAAAAGKEPAKDRWEFPQRTDIKQVLEKLNLADTPTFLVVNGCQASRDDVLRDGDILKIFAVPGGG